MGAESAGDTVGQFRRWAIIHLDTSFLIRALAADSPEAGILDGWVASGEVLAVNAVAWAGFPCDPVPASQLEVVSQILGDRDFTAEHVAIAARLFNATGCRRRTKVFH